jgi:hypothetical protein
MSIAATGDLPIDIDEVPLRDADLGRWQAQWLRAGSLAGSVMTGHPRAKQLTSSASAEPPPGRLATW